MKTALRTALIAALFLPGAAFGASPTVVELYQSQGCSSCPPRFANVNRLVERPDILALTFAVTYWDQLGWKDTFASPEFSARQYDYSHGLQHSVNRRPTFRRRFTEPTKPCSRKMVR